MTVTEEQLRQWEAWRYQGRFGSQGFVVSALLAEVCSLSAEVARLKQVVRAASGEDVQEIAEGYVALRRQLRSLLHQRGIATNPMWSDTEIVSALGTKGAGGQARTEDGDGT